MRFLLSVALIAGSTALLCHGLYFQEAAAGTAGSRPGLTGDGSCAHVLAAYPYTLTAAACRRAALERWLANPPQPDAGLSVFQQAWYRVEHEGFGDELPFVRPHGLAFIGLCALLLGVVLPGTRFRSLTLLVLLVGLGASWPAFVMPGETVALVGFFEPLATVYAHFPQVAVALTFVSGLLLAGRRRPAPRPEP